MEKSKFFEAFLKQQKNPRYQSKSKSNLSFYFQINIDQAGLFYIRIVGGNLREKRVNSDNYSGDLKECIDLYYSEKERIKLVVDWSNPNCRVYLNKNPQILEKLIYLDNLIDDKGKSIYPVLSTSNVKVEIRQFEEFLNCSVVINGSKIEHFICDRWVVSGQKLYSVLPVGQEFKSAIDLNATIKLNELNNYLTILNSNFKNIKIDYKGYRVEDKGVCELLPAVVIEGIDESAYLTISTTYSYKEYITPKFYSMYRPEILTIVNKESETFETYKLELPDFDILDKLINILFFIENKYNLSDSFSIEESGVILNPNISHILFNSELKIVVDNFTLYGEKILLKHKIKTISPNLDLILRDGIDFLEGSAELKIYGESIPLYSAVKSFEDNGYILLEDGTKGVVNSRYIERIKNVIRKSKDGINVSFFDLPYIVDELNCKILNDDFNKKVKSYISNDEIINAQLNLDLFNGSLRSYQAVGVNWMNKLHSIGVSGCLADDMGLGKTVQTLAFLQYILQQKGSGVVLVVVPKSLMFNWNRECEKFTPHLTYYNYYNESKNIDEAIKHNIVFTTYHTLRNDIEEFKKIKFYYTILDEIQNIKNHKSGLAKATFLINSSHKLGISGTPVENNLGDLYSISRFLNPGLFGSFKKFKDEWSGPISMSDNPESVLSNLNRKISPLFLRRIKQEVLKDLPDKNEQLLYVEMEEKQKSYYEMVRKEYLNKIKLKIKDEGVDKSKLVIIKAFLELRQIATIPEVKTEGLLGSPKQDFLLEQVIETVTNGHKVLVFSNFVAGVTNFCKLLTEAGIGNSSITGSTNNREEVVDNFVNSKDSMVLVMTLKTGGVGLNLSVADFVYILDPWWNVAAENQAIDRVHRIGQKNPVFCYRIIARGTIEEKIIELQERKQLLFDSLFRNESSLLNSFSSEDINYLLG